MADELERVGREVGQRGKTRQRAFWGPRTGSWSVMEATLNNLNDDMLWPTEQVTHAIGAVAKGDLTHTIELTVRAARSRASSCAPPRSSTR
jgi:hypothetical protein